MAEISVIMPVYNVEDFLSFTIDSIVNQRFKDWELILVDDGSTDSSGRICDRYAMADDRIHVHHISNAGVSNARNVGLSHATGKYVIFADSDDLCHPECFSYMHEQMQASSCDIIFSSAITIDECVSIPTGDLSDCALRIFTKHSDIKDLPKEFFYVVWGKIYRRELIEANRLRFEVKMNRGEDSLFAYLTALVSDKIGYTSSRFVGYRQRAGSLITNRRRDSALFIQSIHKLATVSDFISAHSAQIDSHLAQAVRSDSAVAALGEFVACNLSTAVCAENIRMLNENLQLFECLKGKHSVLTLRQRLTYSLMRMSRFCPASVTHLLTRLINA